MTREEFMDYVYELLSEDSDNIRANLIIDELMNTAKLKIKENMNEME